MLRSRSMLKKRWNARSWSSSSCWMYLSPRPTSLMKPTRNSVERIAPQTPNSEAVRKAATTSRRARPRPASPTWYAALTIVPRAAWAWPAGSEAEVVAEIGKRKAGGLGFELARRELASSVQRLERSVYDVDERDMGRFDLIYLGSLLVHLRDPVRAIERLRAVCDGTMIVVDGIDLPLSLLLSKVPIATLDARGRPWWWYPNQAGMGRMIDAGGFELLERPRRAYMPAGAGQPPPTLHPRLLKTREGRRQAVLGRRGDPHAVAVQRPLY